MLRIITTVHDAAALAATCQRLGLRPPREGRIILDGQEWHRPDRQASRRSES